MVKPKITEAAEPEPNTEPEPAAEQPEPEPEPEPVRQSLANLNPGDTFSLMGKRYRLHRLEGKKAQVMLLKTVEIGDEVLEMPGNTIIE